MAVHISQSDPIVDPVRLAGLIEKHGQEVLTTIVTSLRQQATVSGARERITDGAAQPARTAAPGVHPQPGPTWRQAGVIEGFHHAWPEVHEHYGPMIVWEGRDEQGPVRLAIGEPRERMTFYGRERGWVSVWEVVNGQPREQRANFVEANDFETTRERIALISGKGGNRKAGFARGEEHLLPAVYRDMSIELHRDRCSGPYAKNRLGVVATDQDVDVMLNHALAHLRLRS